MAAKVLTTKQNLSNILSQISEKTAETHRLLNELMEAENLIYDGAAQQKAVIESKEQLNSFELMLHKIRTICEC